MTAATATEETKEAIYKLLTKEALRLLKISLDFQDKKPSYKFFENTGIYLWPNSRKQCIKHIEKSFLVSGLLLDLIINKPKIIVLIITNLYENHLNLVKENKTSANKRFNSFLAQNIKNLSLRSLTDVSYYVINTNASNFIFKVCESLLQKDTTRLIEIVNEHSPMVGKLLKDFDSFKAYMEFLNIYSCALEALNEIYVEWNENWRTMLQKAEYILKILKFYKKYYEKLYSELELWQGLFVRNPITNRAVSTLAPKKEEGFAFTFTIYYLMTKTIECIAKTLAKINAVTPIYGGDRVKEIQTKLKKSIINYLFDTYTHFCENILLKPWCEGSRGEGIYRYVVLASTPAYTNVAATLLEQTYKLIHNNLEFDLLYKTFSEDDLNNPYKKCKQKIYRIVRCKCIIRRWIKHLCSHKIDKILGTKFEKK